MRVATVLAVACLLALATTAQAAWLPFGFTKAPKFTMDLDKDPEHRWDGAVDLVVGIHGWDNSFGAIFDRYMSRLNMVPLVVADIMYAHLQATYPDRAGELAGLAKALKAAAVANGASASNFTVQQAVLFTYFYEFGDLSLSQARQTDPRQVDRSCTGILSLPADKSLPTIHGRNMDESPIDGRNVTLDITVIKGGKTLYHIFDWTWFTAGTFTAMREGHVTLEENWRDHTFLTFGEILFRILQNKTVPISFMFRNILEAGMSFDEAVHYLNTSQFAAPFYAIMSGPNRVGAVVTGSFNATDNVVEFLNDNSTTTYMVQTNYDRWLPDPMSDPRRTVAEEHLALVGRQRSGTELGVWMAASTYPVHNTHTMYTVLMNVNGPPEGYIRVPMRPLPDYMP